MGKAVHTRELQLNCGRCWDTVRNSNSLRTRGVVVPWGSRAGPLYLDKPFLAPQWETLGSRGKQGQPLSWVLGTTQEVGTCQGWAGLSSCGWGSGSGQVRGSCVRHNPSVCKYELVRISPRLQGQTEKWCFSERCCTAHIFHPVLKVVPGVL